MNAGCKKARHRLPDYPGPYTQGNCLCGLLYFLLLFFLGSCSVSNQIARQVKKDILSDSALLTAHVAISIFEPASEKYWYNHQADKYFTPASNTKLFSLYAGMKYLGDSLPAIRYLDMKDTLFILPTGDPTFLHRDFKTQRLFQFLKAAKKPIVVIKNNWQENAFGSGWSWDDYNDDYMVERSPLPIYGNTVKWVQVGQNDKQTGNNINKVFSEPPLNLHALLSDDTAQNGFFVKRDFSGNVFHITLRTKKSEQQEVPFVTNGVGSATNFLKDTLHVDVTASSLDISKKLSTIYSQPCDSLFKRMMYQSDNFFAEQTLLMAGNEKFGYMNDRKIIDAVLSDDLQDIPQKPTWVDGSGLSRYNLFTPKDFVYILNKLQKDFGFNRLKNILPTGGTGTLGHYYQQDSGFIFAKTGTLSNNAALSGFLITKKNKLLIFSILANNFITEATPFRKAVEKFLTGIRKQY